MLFYPRAPKLPSTAFAEATRTSEGRAAARQLYAETRDAIEHWRRRWRVRLWAQTALFGAGLGIGLAGPFALAIGCSCGGLLITGLSVQAFRLHTRSYRQVLMKWKADLELQDQMSQRSRRLVTIGR